MGRPATVLGRRTPSTQVVIINSFKGSYRYLSNFSESPVILDGVTYPTVEHAFQAAKTFDPLNRLLICSLVSATEAKTAGRMVALREDWDEIRLQVMEDLLRQKFAEPVLQAKLVGTGPHELVEGNTWGDTYWGVCNGKGENHLGKLLMKIRADLEKG